MVVAVTTQGRAVGIAVSFVEGDEPGTGIVAAVAHFDRTRPGGGVVVVAVFVHTNTVAVVVGRSQSARIARVADTVGVVVLLTGILDVWTDIAVVGNAVEVEVEPIVESRTGVAHVTDVVPVTVCEITDPEVEGGSSCVDGPTVKIGCTRDDVREAVGVDVPG